MGDENNNNSNSLNKGDGNNQSNYETFEEYLESADEDVRELYTEHTSGLKSALEKEREERKELSKQLQGLQSKAEKGSELETKLQKTIEELEQKEQQYQQTQKRIRFVEQAGTSDVGCINAKAAWAIAVTDDLFDRNDDPDWEAIKKSAPELFRKTSTDAGKGANSPTGSDINAEIRRKAGYR